MSYAIDWHSNRKGFFMARSLYVMLAASAFFWSGSMAVAADEAVGNIVALQGNSVAVRKGEEQVLAVKSPVFMGDTIKTAEESKLQILFTDDSILAQGANGEVTIDEYVFDASAKEKNAMGMSIMKGVFRTVTGKITALNPERFKVKTRMATIGIRGCDVGFDIQPNADNVAVFELSNEQDVTVTPDAQSGGPGQPQLPVAIPRVGQMVTVGPDGQMTTRDMTAGDVQSIIHVTTPALGGQDEGDQPGSGGQSDPPADGTTGAAPADDAVPLPVDGTEGGEPLPPADDTGDMPLFSDTGSDPSIDDPVDSSLPTDDPTMDSSFETVMLDGSLYESTLFVEDPLALPPEEEPLPPPPEAEPLPPPPDGGDSLPPPPLNGYYVKGSGLNWEWGVWYENGVLLEIEHSNFETGVSAHTTNIIAGGALWNLNGVGPAGAIVEQDMLAVGFLQGQVTVGVTIGQNNRVCNLSFSLSDGVNSASFGGQAYIEDSGRISMTGANFSSFTFTWQGTTYAMGQLDTSTGTWVDGSLVGPGVAPTPITGVVGGFDVMLLPANSPMLAGEFGADVN